MPHFLQAICFFMAAIMLLRSQQLTAEIRPGSATALVLFMTCLDSYLRRVGAIEKGCLF